MAEPTRFHGFPRHAIAIVGIAGRFPGARNPDELWRNVEAGVESLETYSDAQLDEAGVDRRLRENPLFVRRGTTLEGADLFDASFFGVSPREAQILDPQHRVFLECAWEALEHAGYGPGTNLPVTGVYAGTGMNTYLISCITADQSLVASVGGYQLMLGNDKDFLSTRVSYKLNLRGPSLTVQTACSTSLVAVHVACRALEHGECDLALAGGVSIGIPQRSGYLYQEGMILSPDARCRPFDADARGTRPSAGCAIVVLKRLDAALADRDTVHAVIRGAAINNDGAGKAGYTAPSIDGQVEVIAMAQTLAGVDPRSISYIEAHGTGTPLGDPIEVAALTQVFRASTADIGFCHLGSLKANLGHLDAAAGAASLIKTVLALKHRQIPPLVNFRQSNPQLGLASSPFLASADGRPWKSAADAPRRAGVSSFGIGGTNAHVVLEEAPAVTTASSQEPHVLVVSARSQTALEQATANLSTHLRSSPDVSIGDVAWTLQVGRQAFSHRCAVVAADVTQAAELLERPQDRSAMISGVHEGGSRPVAFLFSGQGSQHVGMGRGLYQTEPVYRQVIDRCSEMLEPLLGRDLRTVMYDPADETAINETRFTQPALFATELALATLWQQWGVRPAAMIGHSIGEYVAAHLASVMSLEDALAVVAARGRIMQAMPAGAMAAVHASAAQLERLLTSDVEIAAVNAPGLCTIAGPRDSVAQTLGELAKSGVDARLLHTSHAFHSRMMEPALEEFLAVMEQVSLSSPTMPYVSNVSGTWITPAEATSAGYYATHLRRSVQFAEGIRRLASNTALHFLEVGPGNALATLTRLNLGADGSRRVAASLGHPRDDRSDAESVLAAAGRLWADGVPLDWVGMHATRERRRVPLPTYPFERHRFWVTAPPARVSAATTAPRRMSDVGKWLYAPTWSRADVPFDGLKMHGTWLVLGDAGHLTSGVELHIRERGGRVVHIETGERFQRVKADVFTVRSGVADDITDIVATVRNAGETVSGAFYLWGVTDPLPTDSNVIDRLYHTPVALAAGMRVTPAAPARIIVASLGGFNVIDEPVRQPASNVMLGPVFILPLEIPGLSMRIVDLPPATIDGAPAMLVDEATVQDAERLVAHRAGRRWVRRFDQCVIPPAEPKRLPIKDGGVYLITGGTGGLGLAIAQWLATRARVRLVLTARTPLPPRSEWEAHLQRGVSGDRHTSVIRTIYDIEESGSEVVVMATDAADLSDMQATVAQAVARWGGIHGVIHAAGVAGDSGPAFAKSRKDVDAVLRPKVEGLQVLTQSLGEMSLDFVVLMGSVSAVVGAPGLADYAAANAVLDAFVESAERPQRWKQVVAIDYGSWREVGMAARFEAPEEHRDIWNQILEVAIGTSEGLDALERVLVSGRSRVVVVPFDLHDALRGVVQASIPAAFAAPSRESVPPERAAAEAAERRSLPDGPATEIELRLAAIWTELLGVERIGLCDDFFDLGGHSLLATRVLARIDETFGVRLALRDVFDAPTLEKLSQRIAATTPPARAEDREEIEF